MASTSIALVTGAARGLGRSFAQQLLNRGYKVCIADMLEDHGRKTSEELAQQYGQENVIFQKCDVTSDEDFAETWTQATEKLGPISLLVNNAGLGNETNWQLTMNVNLGGCIRGTNLAMEKMDESAGGQGGIVINVASIAGVKPTPPGPVYSATKHGIVGLTRSYGNDFYYKRTNVKVMCLCPSLVDTQFLIDSADNASSEYTKQVMQKMNEHFPKLELSEIDEGFVKLLDDEKNGSVLVVEKGKELFYVESPL